MRGRVSELFLNGIDVDELEFDLYGVDGKNDRGFSRIPLEGELGFEHKGVRVRNLKQWAASVNEKVGDVDMVLEIDAREDLVRGAFLEFDQGTILQVEILGENSLMWGSVYVGTEIKRGEIFKVSTL